MTWYGESYALDGGNATSGPTWNANDVLHHFDDLHHVLSAGDGALIGSYADPRDYTAFVDFPDPIEIRWAIEVRGGSGTLRLSTGVDPDWNYTDTSLITQGLGTFTVTGPATIVSPPITVIDKAGLLAYAVAPMVWLECLTGTVDVQQVKLRVWPTAGPSGAWVATGAPFTEVGGVSAYQHAYINNFSPQVPTYAEAWELGKDAFDAIDGATLDSASAPMTWSQFFGSTAAYDAFFYLVRSTTDAPFEPFASTKSLSAVYVPQLPEYATAVPSSLGTDPREIYADFGRSRFRAIGGADFLRPTGSSWNTGASIVQQNAGYVAAQSITFVPGDPAPFEAPARQAAPTGAVFVADFATVPFTPPGPGPFVVTGYPATYIEEPVEEDRLGSSTGRISGLTTTIAYPAYEVFDPSLPWVNEETPRPPRFYVTYAAVEGDPRESSHVVGIGKPADDASLFRVRTPMGTYRELRHGEKVSDVSIAHPLKVKLYDGSWTIVAGMTLDA